MADLVDELAILEAAADFYVLHAEFERSRACILRAARERVDRLALKLVPEDGLTDEERARRALALAQRGLDEAARLLDAEEVA